MKHGPWTAADDRELLALHAAGTKWLLIAKRLDRTEVATASRAAVLKRLAERDGDAVVGDDVMTPEITTVTWKRE